MSFVIRTSFFSMAVFALSCSARGQDARPAPFAIEVVDSVTKRGVPLVELRTVNEIRWFTDSNGLAAIDEPGLMGQKVFFHIKSHGYEFPKDGFGIRGKAVEITPGGSTRIEIKRINIAERLYRITGQGIYRDTVLLGKKPPIDEGLLNAKVLGSDSVVNAIFQGKLYWFWGDTNRPEYPLGSFHVPGATSLLPKDGGLSPNKGVNLNYFVDKDGFAKKTAEMPGEGPTWIFGVATVKDPDGSEHLFAHYQKVRQPMVVYEHGLCEFNPKEQKFEKTVVFENDFEHRFFYPGGQTLAVKHKDTEFIYFATPFPLTRVRAISQDMRDLSQYESYTCLKEGTRLDQAEIERDKEGKAVFAWKKNTPPVGMIKQEELVNAGKLKREECILGLTDVDTGKRVLAHTGSVFWNDYLQGYVMIAVEQYGSTSLLGEIWMAVADTPLGPWAYATKIATHDDYSFYNPKHHPYLDEDNGRVIYFEGTFTRTFSGNKDPVPRYDYNQIMYKLDLSDPRLNLPRAVYRLVNVTIGGSPTLFYFTLASRSEVRFLFEGDHHVKPPVLFFALSRPMGTGKAVPVFQKTQYSRLSTAKPEGNRYNKDAVFFALPTDIPQPIPNTVRLIHRDWNVDGPNWVDPEDGRTEIRREDAGHPLCRVWLNPIGIDLPIKPD